MDRLIDDPLALLPRPIGKLLWPIIQFLGKYRHNLWILATLAIVVVMAPLLGVFTSIHPLIPLILLALPLVIASLYLVMPRPQYGPIIILFAALFIPLKLPTGTDSRLVDSFLLTIFFVGNWLATMIFVDKKFSIAPSPSNKPLLGFVTVMFISTVWSNLFKDPLVDPTILSKRFLFVQMASALTMVMLPCAFLLVSNHIHNIKLIKQMVIMMLVAGVGGILLRLGDVPGDLVNDGGLFTMWIVALAAGLAFFNKNLHWAWRVLLLLVIVGWLYYRFILQITWLAGWLSSVAVLGIIIFMRSKKLLAVLVLVAAIYLALNSSYYFGKVLGDETDESGLTRLAAWEVNWRVTGKHLLFGTGPAGYAVYYVSYFPRDAMATHNNFIDVLAQTGLVGFALVLWFFIGLIWQSYKLCLRLSDRYDFVHAMANVGLAGVAGSFLLMMFGDWMFPFTYTQSIAGFDYVVYSWLFMGMVPVLDRLYPAQEQPSGDTMVMA